ncbi:MAG TPA: YbjQ family protein [Acidobacteriota bacterium]|nr:YbjQ family protein [Acidobacteriota bacterium]
MMLVTTEEISGKRVTKTLGIVRGNTIRARHIGGDIIALLRNLVGGEIHEYVKLMGEAREQAIDRMLEEARELDADAIITVRFATSEIMSGAAELLVYGTAVKLEDLP